MAEEIIGATWGSPDPSPYQDGAKGDPPSGSGSGTGDPTTTMFGEWMMATLSGGSGPGSAGKGINFQIDSSDPDDKNK